MTDRPFWQRLIFMIFPALKRIVNFFLVIAMRILRATVNTIREQI